jgi:hypothetical protein
MPHGEIEAMFAAVQNLRLVQASGFSNPFDPIKGNLRFQENVSGHNEASGVTLPRAARGP